MKGIASIAFGLLSCCASASAAPRIFMTSTQGSGNLSSWPDAHGHAGLDAADEICRTRASVASLPDAVDYIAWLSDSNDDAYCRAHGLTGSRLGTRCGQAQEPSGAGPWYRMDDLSAMDVLPLAVGGFKGPGYQPRHILYDEYGSVVPLTLPIRTDLAFTGSEASGTFDPGVSTCTDWTSTSGDATLGSAYYGFTGLSDFGDVCSHDRRLVCLQRGAHGPALSRRAPPTARRVFATSSAGSGNMSTWPEAGDATGTAAADAVCRVHAAYGGLPLPHTYKAWLSTSTSDARTRFSNTGPWYRTDGVRVAASLTGLLNGTVEAPIQLDEFGEPLGFEGVWTGTTVHGAVTNLTCADWTSDTNVDGGTDAAVAAADGRWTTDMYGGFGCSQALRIYCFADNDSLFLDGVDP